MGRMTKGAKKEVTGTKPVAKTAVGVTSDRKFESSAVTNYMGANSYTLDPLATLKLIAASSIFGEPKYYEGRSKSADVLEKAIDAALDYNFEGTLHFAVELREKYYMRLNPQIIMVRAAVHKNRANFTASHPQAFSDIQAMVARRPDDLTVQVEYYLSGGFSGSGNKAAKMPGILKRSIANRLGKFSRYHIGKYQNKGIGLVDVVRLTHATSEPIHELIKNGKIEITEDNQTWRNMRSRGVSWVDILNSNTRLSHSDYMFNLRGILESIPENDYVLANKVVTQFLSGVEHGMLFPSQYWMAYKTIERGSNFNHYAKALDALEEAMKLATKSQRKLNGRVAVLVDNSGSARSGTAIEGKNLNIYEIGNLSGVVTAMSADEGYVGVFGDKLEMIPIRNNGGVIEQVKKANNVGERIGHSTENGIWLFWKDAIENKTHYDNVFIYSDQQAGTGGLYGINPREYAQYTYDRGYGYREFIDVWKLVEDYRKKVNPRVNVFSVQIAGYDNTILPENKYRGANLTGWTGKEVAFAQAIIDVWDSQER